MPTYEYACRACGHTFDVVQRMTDDPLRVCPECGGELRKVFAPPAISFKGSGFYATDHGKKAKPAGSDEGGGSKKKPSEPSKDAKPSSSEPTASKESSGS
jgi:putative FmdB family regulatory protein